MRRQQKNSARRAAASAAAVQRFADGISNPLLRIGTGTPNTFRATTYLPKFTTMARQLLEWAYQTSWLCGLVVDIPAEDMTREGIDIRIDDPRVADALREELDDYAVFDSLCEAVKWARLYGGSIAVIMIDGQDVSTPLTDVRKGSFRGLYVFDRWQLDSQILDPVQELGRDFGKPEYYRVIAKSSDVDFQADRIHYSRVIRFEGRRLPYYLRQSYQGWGASVIEPVFDRIKGFDLATEGATQLLSKAYLRYYKVKGIRQILTNPVAAKGFLTQMDYVREFQNAEGLTVGDAEDDFQTLTYTFTGIPEVLLQLGQQISGAFGIPLVRLFGQSPAGLNSTGESDIRNYYDNVKKLQRTMLRSGIKRLLDVAYQSATGRPAPDDLNFDFRSLWQMSHIDKSQVASAEAAAIQGAYADGLISLPTAMKELKALSDTVGVFASITDEDIKEAEKQEAMDPPPGSEPGGGEGLEDFYQSEEAVPGAAPDGQKPQAVPNPAPQGRPAGRGDSQGQRLGGGPDSQGGADLGQPRRIQREAQ